MVSVNAVVFIFPVSVSCDQVNQVVPAHQVDDIDEVHELDPVHQVDHKDEHGRAAGPGGPGRARGGGERRVTQPHDFKTTPDQASNHEAGLRRGWVGWSQTLKPVA